MMVVITPVTAVITSVPSNPMFTFCSSSCISSIPQDVSSGVHHLFLLLYLSFCLCHCLTPTSSPQLNSASHLFKCVLDASVENLPSLSSSVFPFLMHSHNPNLDLQVFSTWLVVPQISGQILKTQKCCNLGLISDLCPRLDFNKLSELMTRDSCGNLTCDQN